MTIAILLGATWPLWSAPRDFPAVPLLAFAIAAPQWMDGGALGAMCCGLVLVLASVFAVERRAAASRTSTDLDALWPELRRAGWILFLVAALGLIVLNQQRCQPWLWQAVLLAVLFSTQDARSTLHAARLIVLSIYAFSAAGKLDASFLQSHGPALVDGLLHNVNRSLPAHGTVRTVTAALLPLGEMLAAAALAFPWSRRIGLWVSAGMHLALMAALGPGGLNHKPGVLVWNAFFLAQNALLFSAAADIPLEFGEARAGNAGSISAKPPETITALPKCGKQAAMASVMALAAVLPFAEWYDRLDPWLGWSLYASRPPRLQFFVDEQSVARLPDGLRPFVEPPAPLERWRRVRIDRWSLAATSAPISPQIRFQLGVVLSIADRATLHDDLRVVVESSADRRTGRRSVREIIGANALREFAATFHFNVRPRPSPHQGD
ncbi:MAG: hypothetical protein IT428_28595 [Planctomycetaceae bacterium]|nr:hypothetical protein [Planctomycetaceae bacterium]